MANIVIHDLYKCEHLDRESSAAVWGGRFGALFGTPYELTRGSSGGGGTTIVNFLIDEFVQNTITQVTVQNIEVAEAVDSTVTVIAPQTVAAEQQGTIGAFAGDLFAQVP